MWQVWIILAGIFIIFEMIIPTDFLIFWVGIGACIAAVCSIFVNDITAQIIIFVVSSILLLFCTKPFTKKFTKCMENIHTNAYSIIGKNGEVTSDINPIKGVGQIKVGSEVWSAKTEGSNIITKGTIVTVKSIDGVKAIVNVTDEKTTVKEKETEDIQNENMNAKDIKNEEVNSENIEKEKIIK